MCQVIRPLGTLDAIKWSAEQARAINKLGSNILVSASAGSGKTAVLVERIKQLILGSKNDNPVPADRLLVVTFTEAAASEMKQKIIAAVTDELEKSGDEKLRSQLRRLHFANISTFHAFALSIVKRYYFTINNLEPGFSVADEYRSELLSSEALDTLFNEYFDAGDKRLDKFLLRYARSKNEDTAREIITELHSFIMQMPNPFAWLDNSVASIGLDTSGLVKTDMFASLAMSIGATLERAYESVIGIQELLSETGATAFAAKFEDCIQILWEAEQTANELASQPGAELYDNLGALITSFSFPRAVTIKAEKEYYESVKEIVTFRRDRIKKNMKKLGEKFFAKPLADYVSDINDTHPQAAFLAELVKRYDELFSAAKRRDGLIDFSDFEHMALQILEDEKICAEYREKFEYIFIDEYQDTNYIQEELISRIVRADNLFMVGDVKQSIYQFRLAEPGIFIDKYNNVFADSEEALNHRVNLNLNFRSKESILLYINNVFSNIMRADLCGVNYDDDAALKKGIAYDGLDARPNLILIDRLGSDEPALEEAPEYSEYGEEISSMKDAQLEALVAAKEINRVMSGEEFFDIKEGGYRKFRYNDIVVLLREARTSGQIWYDTLQSCGIPAYIDSGDGYFDTVEVETFLNLLKVIDNARQDVPLVGTLYSPVFGFSLEDLAAIRIASEDSAGPFYKSFFAYAENGPSSELLDRCRNAITRIEQWRYDESFMTLPDFIWKLLKESGYYDYAGALPGGSLRRANLRVIADRALTFTLDVNSGLFGFLGFVEKIKKKHMSAPQIKLFGEGDNAVRIMTVHASKGLEFPYIIVAQMGKKLKGGTASSRMDLHRNIGLSLQWENPDEHIYRKTLAQHIIAAEKNRETRAEDLRILYVAMTRAMDRLTLIGTSKDAGKALARAESTNPESDIDPMNVSSWTELILPVILHGNDDVDVRKAEDLTGIYETDISDVSDCVKDPSLRGASATKQSGDLGITGLLRCARKDEFVIHAFSHIMTSEPSEYAKEVDKRLSFVYPGADMLHVKSKYSATEINASLKSERVERVFYTEGSADERREDEGNLTDLSAAERGTALHTALEKLDFSKAYANRNERSYFTEYVSDLVNRGFLTYEAANAVNPNTLQQYANTAMFARAAAAPVLRKETPFNVKYKHQGREVVVQGIIDCWFTENGKIVLIDYKSGRYNADDPTEAERITGEYGVQIDIYRTALERITGREVAEAWLYMTGPGAAVNVPKL